MSNPVNNNDAKIKVIGVGKAGVNILNKLNDINKSSFLELAVVDTDKTSIENSNLENKFLLGQEWYYGHGCGGNVIKGERALAHKSNVVIKDFISDASLLIIVAGFGKGTGTGGSVVVARLAKDSNIPVIVMPTLPFIVEGQSKYDIAEDQIKLLIRGENNTVIPIPNDLLYAKISASTPLKEAFEISNNSVAAAVLGVAELLSVNNILSVDLCAMHNALYRKKSECSIGLGMSKAEDKVERCNEAINNLFNSPLLGGQQRIKEADTVIVSLTGGSDMSIGDVKYTLDILHAQVDKNSEIIVGANTDEAFDGMLQITVIPITIDADAEPFLSMTSLKIETSAIAKKASKTEIMKGVKKVKGELEQLELPFKNQTRGIFTSYAPTIFDDIDLDIPTYQRYNIHLDIGK